MTRTIRWGLFIALATIVCRSTLTLAGVDPAAAAIPPPLAPPGNLAAAAGNARIVLTWLPVENATGYRIFRTTAGVWGLSPVATVAGTTYSNGGLTNGTPYSYRVAGYNAGGLGPSTGEVSATPMAPPAGVSAVAGDRQVTLSWQASAGALSYTVYRSTSSVESTFVPVAADIIALSFVDSGLTNKTTYFYRVRAIAAGGTSALSARVQATPLPPPPASAPSNLTAAPGNARVTLTWGAVSDATSYRVFRTTTDVFDGPAIATVTGTTFTNSLLTNGTTYTYRVAGRNDGGLGPFSGVASATPVAPPPAPPDVTATAGDHQVTLNWSVVPEATGYNIFRSTRSARYSKTPLTSMSATTFVDSGLENGPTFYYTVTATNAGGSSPASAEVSATTEGPQLVVDPETTAAFRLLRQATWGPRQSDVDHVKEIGAAAFLQEQLAAPSSIYPSTLFSQPVEMAQEHFMQLALTGPDQLRQRVAWALHKIWVVSAVEVPGASAIVTYYRTLMDRALGNYRDLMKAVTLNPAMGRYLNMLNNRSQKVTGTPPNENYAREVMQLFTIGTSRLNPDGAPVLDGGLPVSSYSEDDVRALARILTGWTFGDGNPATIPRRPVENYRVPMEAFEANHDVEEKVFLGQSFPAGQTAVQDLEQALDALFNHPNVGPFVAKQLIQQLVTSNPSPSYVRDVAAVFDGGGASGRGDLAAVVAAILTHPEAAVTSPVSGKLAEPVLFVTSIARALNAVVTDHPFMSDKVAEMGQKVFYPPSVFSYFSPGYRVRGTEPAGGPPLLGPEYQILTSVTALARANFIGQLIGGRFGGNVTIDYTPFTSRARDAAALVDYCGLVITGGRLTPLERAEIIAAVRRTPIEQPQERTRTALYLTLAIAQSQVDR